MCACIPRNVLLCMCSVKKDIKVGQVWTTTSRYKVRIIAVDRRDSLPIVGLYFGVARTSEGIGTASLSGSSSVWGELISEYKELQKATRKIYLKQHFKDGSCFLDTNGVAGNGFKVIGEKTITITEGEGL